MGFDAAWGCSSGATKVPCCQHRGLPGLPNLDCNSEGPAVTLALFSLLPLYYRRAMAAVPCVMGEFTRNP